MRKTSAIASMRTPAISLPLAIAVLALFLFPGVCLAAPRRLAGTEAYHRYVDPLVAEKDFKTHYFEDGASDASVLFPSSAEPPCAYITPAASVIQLVRLGKAGLPVLIDCLSDGRITTMQFDGNTTTRHMNVPVGYVCLDILMNEVAEGATSDSECGDGLGACMKLGFYFRPDDYHHCSGQTCFVRPWVSLVQQKWSAAYLNHRLKFRNPYDSFPVEEYKQFRTTSR